MKDIICPISGLKLCKIARWELNFTQAWLAPLALLGARLWLAKVFWQSGQTKLANWDTTLALFEYEYAVPLLPTNIAALMATAGEIVFPILLVLGFLTRLGAFGVLAMTAVIELFVYPGVTEHYYWLLLGFILLTHGSGKYGVDYWWEQKLLGKAN